MAIINIMALRHSAFYAPLLMTIKGGYLTKQGLKPVYTVATPDNPVEKNLHAGTAHLSQSAPAVSFAAQDQKTIYPSAAQQLSEQEQQFLSRIQIISKNQSLFNEQYELRTTNNRFETVSQKLSQLSRSSQDRSDTSMDKQAVKPLN